MSPPTQQPISSSQSMPNTAARSIPLTATKTGSETTADTSISV
jgi:hypothetical protein